MAQGTQTGDLQQAEGLDGEGGPGGRGHGCPLSIADSC